MHGDDPEMIWGGRWEGGSGLGTHVHPWLIHVTVWQNQYSIVKQNKVKIKIKKKKEIVFQLTTIQSEEKRQIPCAEKFRKNYVDTLPQRKCSITCHYLGMGFSY